MKTAAACALLLLVSAPAAAQRTVGVATAAELEAAVRDAAAGDTIVLASGTYALGHRLDTRVAGTAALPIVVRSASRGTALVRFSSATGVVEGFVVTHAHWRFEDLVLEGDCADHSDCEHAWHVVGEADFTVIRGNVARGFNAHIKANGADLDGAALPRRRPRRGQRILWRGSAHDREPRHADRRGGRPALGDPRQLHPRPPEGHG